MKTKTISPEAAQKNVWKAELKQHLAARTKVSRDITAEFKRSEKALKTLERSVVAARKKHTATGVRLERLERRQLADIDRRIGILKGRIGI
jgi:Skp family chaperone for outer membrane proteins